VKLLRKQPSVARHLMRIEIPRTGTHPLLLGLGLVDEVVLGGRSLVRESAGGMSMMRSRRHGSKMSISYSSVVGFFNDQLWCDEKKGTQSREDGNQAR
jgi:hypothetical protein